MSDPAESSDRKFTFLGATVIEWSIGLVVFVFLFNTVTHPAEAMPILLLAWAVVSLGIAAVRVKLRGRDFREALMDEEKFCNNPTQKLLRTFFFAETSHRLLVTLDSSRNCPAAVKRIISTACGGRVKTIKELFVPT